MTEAGVGGVVVAFSLQTVNAETVADLLLHSHSMVEEAVEWSLPYYRAHS